MDNQTLIDKYIKGQLTPDETKAFEHLKSNDEAFRNELAFAEDLSAVIKKVEKEKLKQLLSDHHNKMKVKTKKNNTRRIISISIGVLLILAAFLGYQYEKKQKSPSGIYASYFEPFPNTFLPVTRSSIDNATTQGFTAYESGNYVLAAEKFEESLQTKKVLEIVFYQGVCYGAMGNLPLAIKNMEDMKRFESAYIDQAYWYLGLFYLKQKNYDLAIKNFQDYIELAKNEDQRKEAIDILKRIM